MQLCRRSPLARGWLGTRRHGHGHERSGIHSRGARGVRGCAASTPGSMNAGRSSSGPAIRAAHPGQQAGLHARGGAHAGARHRSEHRDLHADGSGDVPAAEREGRRPPGGGGRSGTGIGPDAQPQRHPDPVVASPVRRAEGQERRVRRRAGRVHGPAADHDGEPDGPRRRRPRLRDVLRRARAASRRGSPLHRGRRPHPRRAPGGGARPRLLDAALRRRPPDRGPGPARQRTAHDGGGGRTRRVQRGGGGRVGRRLRAPHDALAGDPDVDQGAGGLAGSVAHRDGAAEGRGQPRAGRRPRQRPL